MPRPIERKYTSRQKGAAVGSFFIEIQVMQRLIVISALKYMTQFVTGQAIILLAIACKLFSSCLTTINNLLVANIVKILTPSNK